MFDEPHVYRDNYLQAEVAILAGSREDALELLREDGKWDVEELNRIAPRVVDLDSPVIICKHVDF